MNKKEDTTKVIFRKFQGEIVALFPELPANHESRLCMSYAHIGQHSGADIQGVIDNSKLAKESEYKSLEEELERIGYNLDVKKRYSYKMYQNRVDEIKAWIGE